MVARTLLSVVLLLALGAPASAQRPDPQTMLADACELGELRSCGVLGLVYETGAGGVRDVGRAMELYERACAREVAAACVRLDLVKEDPPGQLLEDPFVRVGRVADAENGAPLANALIELPGLELRRIADLEGRVELGRLPRGTHRIVVRRFGYEEVAGELPVPWEGEFLLLMYPELADESPTLGSVFGQVTDAASGTPLANVEVTLLAPNPVRTITNPEGRFSFGGVAPGEAEVRLNLLGYEERRTDLDVQAGRTVEVYATLSVQPIELEPIEVTVGSPYLDRTGFFRRARGGAGYLLTRRDFQAIDPMRVSEVFMRVPGVFVEQTRLGAQVVTRREMGRDRPGPCRLRAYLDGMPMPDWDIDQVRPDDIEGVEVHQGLAAPIEYRNLTNPDGTYPCGVVLIWTTRGG
ncbi:MAG TPA: carboxypeptidase regulatory-like domain-containing protein [Longimicrobiales bacterium]|nr:carboxypeptidase regulatory-like domain-containing protein [Longimicrobiales bacterium]